MSVKFKLRSLLISLLLIFLFSHSLSVRAAVNGQTVPKLQVLKQPASEYKKGSKISFTVGSLNFKGKVQYRVVLNNCTTKKTSELWNTPATGYYNTAWQPKGDYNFIINWSANNMAPGTYNFTVFVRRSGTKAAYDSFIKTNSFIIKEDVKIKNIDNIDIHVKQGENFVLPGILNVLMSDDTTMDVAVNWNAYTVNTIKIGTFTYEGTVAGYDKKTTLTLTVSPAELGNTGGNLVNSGMVTSKDGWIYYTNLSDKGKLYKKRMDGTEKTKLSEYLSDDINIVGNWIYCRGYDENGDFCIFKVTTNGEQLTKISEDLCITLTVINEWIYYVNSSNNSKIYRMKTDGSEKTKLSDDKVGAFIILDNWIYFTNSADKSYLYKMDLDGGQRTQLTFDTVFSFDVEKDQIYYVALVVNGSGDIYTELHKMKLDGTEGILISDSREDFFSINVVDEWIYYSNISEDLCLYKIKTDGTQKTRITYEGALYISIIGDWVYYTYSEGEDEDEKLELHFIKVDGTGKGILQ